MFYKAMTHKDTFTENGMPTNSTSGNPVVDLFFAMGASRTLPEVEIQKMFARAYAYNKQLAVRAMFYNRDVRGGQGERRSFRAMLKWLADTDPEMAKRVLRFVPEYGRWDDLFTVFDTEVGDIAIEMIRFSLLQKNALCAKWMPREGKKGFAEYGYRIMKSMGLTPRKYRKMLTSATKVVESKMCANQWWQIEYEHVPSVAHAKYRKAFGKHEPTRYVEYLHSVEKGEKKINAGAIFPHTIVAKAFDAYGSLSKTERMAMNAQWKALPNYVKDMSFIPVCDVSGSMDGEPMDVAVSLSIYLAERNKSAFKDMFFTFSEKPQLVKIEGEDVCDKAWSIARSSWSMNTNLEAVFNLMLDRAVQFGIPEKDMPEAIIILSDMQFDECVHEPNDDVYDMISRKYESAGYRMPVVVFWCLRKSEGVPVAFDKHGTALVSGFSPSIMQSILGGEMNPISIMLKTLNSPRYSDILAD